MSPEPDATPTLRPRHCNDARSKSTKVQKNVFDFTKKKDSSFKVSTGAWDAMQSGDQRRYYVQNFPSKKVKS